MSTLRNGQSPEQALRSARGLRERLWNDPYRPRFHLMPPDGFFNDANGTIYWKGRYHVFYLGRMPNPNPDKSSDNDWLPVWDHSSSADLVHWIHHPPAIVPAFDGTTPNGIYSGDAVENAEIPTLIYHVPGQGTCIATSEDEELMHWTPFDANPVIPVSDRPTEYVVFDPCAWKEPDAYYALIGNKNHSPGYEGDCTSLFRSPDLMHWEYLYPFYKSDRRWTDEIEDCACPDFFPIGNRHMLLMHTHRPYGQCQYYLGRYDDHVFYPEDHGKMNWPGGLLMAPETLLDEDGRRIFFGWISEGAQVPLGEGHCCSNAGWGSVMSLPRVLSLDVDGKLLIDPVSELQTLRKNYQHRDAAVLQPDEEINLSGAEGDCFELTVELELEDAKRTGVKLRCSPDGEEQTTITYDVRKSTIIIEENESAEKSQEAPFELPVGRPLELRIFLDRSVLEVFANRRQCVTHRIYPDRGDSMGIRIFSHEGRTHLRSFDKWDMSPV